MQLQLEEGNLISKRVGLRVYYKNLTLDVFLRENVLALNKKRILLRRTTFHERETAHEQHNNRSKRFLWNTAVASTSDRIFARGFWYIKDAIASLRLSRIDLTGLIWVPYHSVECIQFWQRGVDSFQAD